MSTYRITCINKDDRQNPYERIKFVGLGGTEKYTQQQVVRWIDGGEHKFYVERGGKRANVITATSPYGNRYIKTEADGSEPNNLLSLQECVN